MEEQRQVRQFHSKLAGVTSEADGTHPQKLLARCTPGQRLVLVPDPSNQYDKYAIRVCLDTGEQLGWIGKHLSKDLTHDLKDGLDIEVEISEVTGGGFLLKPTRGCNILISVYQPVIGLDELQRLCTSHPNRETPTDIRSPSASKEMIFHELQDAFALNSEAWAVLVLRKYISEPAFGEAACQFAQAAGWGRAAFERGEVLCMRTSKKRVILVEPECGYMILSKSEIAKTSFPGQTAIAEAISGLPINKLEKLAEFCREPKTMIEIQEFEPSAVAVRLRKLGFLEDTGRRGRSIVTKWRGFDLNRLVVATLIMGTRPTGSINNPRGEP
jgi:hypothetical protein